MNSWRERPPKTSTPGKLAPITIPQLVGYLDDRFACCGVPYSERHLYRISRAETDLQIDTLWLLAEIFACHPAYLLGENRCAPNRWLRHGEAPNALTRAFSARIGTALRPEHRELADLIVQVGKPSNRSVKPVLEGRSVPKLNELVAVARCLNVEPSSLI